MKKQFIEHGAYKPEYESDNCGVGFIVDTNGRKSHKMIDDGLDMLNNMAHRGAVGYDDQTGDGAGLKFQIPHDFFKMALGNDLPSPGDYAVGMIFLPLAPDIRFECMATIERIISNSKLEFIQWRNVPINTTAAGSYARSTLPEIQQLFIKRNEVPKNDFEKELFILRKNIDSAILNIESEYIENFYICSLSSHSIVYKGLLLANQMKTFFKDLQSTSFKTAYIVVHQRYSTNTSPSWKLAHPFKYIAHNGEINTIKGNIQKFESKKENLESKIFGDALVDIEHLIEKDVSDSANLDNIVELFTIGGRSILHALAMLIPQPWENANYLNENVVDFYKYHSNLIEPWDGPATIIFSDDQYIGTKLDRNGLRPARYYVTKNKVIMASEAGVVGIKDDQVISRGKIKPGEFLAVDLDSGSLMLQKDILETFVTPEYTQLIKKNELTVKIGKSVIEDAEIINQKQVSFGYTREELKRVIAVMAKDGKEPILSMGTDTPLAVLSEEPKLLFDYFKQLFAQVTNPAIDPIREKNVMSLRTTIGNFKGLLDGKIKDEESKFLTFEHPIVNNQELDGIQNLMNSDFRSIKIPMVFDSDLLGSGLEKGLELICQRVEKAIENDFNIIILSDKMIDKFRSPIPSLLALAAVNTHLLKKKIKTKVDLIVETGEARDPMHIALLFGYGATVVNPYLALDTINSLVNENLYIKDLTPIEAKKNYIKALEKGLLKILSKMGISTLNSYIGAQLFEIIGLNREIVESYFNGTSHTITGIDLDIIAEEVFIRHENAFFKGEKIKKGSELHYKKDGIKHLFTPEVIGKLQNSCRTNNYNEYKEYSEMVNDSKKSLITLRGLLTFESDRQPIPIDSVEPIENILKKFVTGAMSFGSLSKEAHENLAVAMNSIGASSNSGEGGEDKDRYYTNKKSKIKQIAAGRFGVSIEYLNDAEEIQIKVSQGAKPGEGGHLPGKKVVGKVAEIRHAIENLPLISPPPHHDIYSIEDLEQLIYDLKASNPKARISVKLVSRAGIGTIAAGVVKGHADMILVSGHDGGTGAAPMTSIKNAGVPWEIGLSETHQTLLMNNLRKKVSLQVDGQMRTGRDVLVATLLGAEEYGFATAPLVVSGCIMMRKCHTNKCPVGVATQDPELRKYFKGKPEHVVNYFTFIAKEIREYLANLGYESLDQLVGRSDLLKRKDLIDHWKIKNIDLSQILFKPELPKSFGSKHVEAKALENIATLDDQLIAILNKNTIEDEITITNTNRSIGTKLSSYIIKNKLKIENEKVYKFKGTAGQSFGAFLTAPIVFQMFGDANDYVAKGLSGGTIIVKHPDNKIETDILVGNTTLYGAIKGKLFINGQAGERFAVRNSGAISVVEGVGNHGCEYMTNGIVVVLGDVGDNFAAGMTGGIAYVLNKNPLTESKVNKDTVSVKDLNSVDQEILKSLLEEHIELTGSLKAKSILDEWMYYSNLFVKVSSDGYDAIAENKGLENLVNLQAVNRIG
ncbi:MAG TPA: glutamate synthase large subunit [Clostridia bacterium]|nr:glutamate synthase large subunit [Clostridia bacterium]